MKNQILLFPTPMRAILRPVVLVAALLLSFSKLAAQEPSIDSGRRLQIRAGQEQIVGTFVSLDSGTILISVGEEVRRIPVETINRLEVYDGRQSFGTVKGAVIGLGVGLVVGVGITYAILTAPGRCEGDACFGTDTLASFVLPPAVGLVAGGVLGGKKVDRWKTITLEQLKLSLSPDSGNLLAFTSIIE